MPAEKLIRKGLQRYWRYSRGLTMGAQGMVIDGAGRVLLIRHTYRPGWHFPGGGVEKGETVVDALARELAEETGVELTGSPELFGIYANHRLFPGDHIVLYVVRAWRQARAPEPNAEIAEQRLFSPDALPAEVHGPTRDRIREVIAGTPRALSW
jgi:8-oxo-dGTP pyrophosphatase MutT (NUDIX family)